MWWVTEWLIFSFGLGLIGIIILWIFTKVFRQEMGY
jgi:hypothetical protein